MVDGYLSKLVKRRDRSAAGKCFGPDIVSSVHLGAFPFLENKLIGYSDDSTLIAVVPSPGVRVTVTESLSRDLVEVSERCDLWGIKLNASKTKTMIVFRSSTMIPVTGINYWWNCAERVWRWLLRSIFALFREQHLKGLVCWGSHGKYSIIDCFLGELSWFCHASFGVLFCIVMLGWPTHLELLDHVVSGASFLIVGVFWVLPCSILYVVQDHVYPDPPSLWWSTTLHVQYVPVRVSRGAVIAHSYLCQGHTRQKFVCHNAYVCLSWWMVICQSRPLYISVNQMTACQNKI